MLYKRLTQQELQGMNIETEHGIFTTQYEYVDYTIEKDEETGEVLEEYYTNLTINKTAQEVYTEWLENKDKPSIPPIDETRIWQDQVEEAIGLLATQVAQNTLLQNGGK